MTDDLIEETKEPGGGDAPGGGGAENAAQAGGQNTQNRPVRPRPPQPVRNYEPAQNGKGRKKKKKHRLLVIILILVIVILVGGFVFEELYFNFLHLRDAFIDAVVRLDPDYRSREMRLDDRETDIYKRETELKEREKTVDSKETQNIRRSAELDAREKKLSDQEAWMTPKLRSQLTAQEILDMQSLSKSYAQMAPDAAAAILVKLKRPDDAAIVLYYMTERNAGAILAAMEPDFAAAITEILLYD